MSSQQTATFQEALAILESLPEYQQEDLIHIMQRRRLERRRELLAERIKEARAEYARGDVKRGTVDELIQGVTA
jgi:aminoglycoside phosphotransferase family enzyme